MEILFLSKKYKLSSRITIAKPGLLFLLIYVMYGCTTTPKNKEDQWNYSKNEITGSSKAGNEKISVDIYLDVTTSMKGYVSSSPTNFSNLIDDIEATCQNTWKDADIKFFKFGRSVVPVSRAEFITGKNSTVMFSDPRLSTQTNFAGALQNTNAARVSILITDLFYNNSDVNLVANAIKDSCLKKNPRVELGIIGLTSPFDGIVGDVSPAVKVKGNRPVYVMLFAEKQNINLMFTALKNKPYMKGNQLLLLTEKPVESYTVEVKKNPKNRTINIAQGKIGGLKDYGTVYGFSMDAREKDAQLDLTVSINTTPFIADFGKENIRYWVFKKTVGKTDSTAADDEIKLTSIQKNGNIITSPVALTSNDPEGKYSYAVYMGLNNADPQLPAWVDEINTDSFAQGVNENKTLNLKKLLTDISKIFNTERQPKIAKFFIHLEKK